MKNKLTQNGRSRVDLFTLQVLERIFMVLPAFRSYWELAEASWIQRNGHHLTKIMCQKPQPGHPQNKIGNATNLSIIDSYSQCWNVALLFQSTTPKMAMFWPIRPNLVMFWPTWSSIFWFPGWGRGLMLRPLRLKMGMLRLKMGMLQLCATQEILCDFARPKEDILRPFATHKVCCNFARP